jgi:hypothetical protein
MVKASPKGIDVATDKGEAQEDLEREVAAVSAQGVHFGRSPRSRE